MTLSASRIGIPATPATPRRAGGGGRELRPSSGLLPHVAHPNHFTGFVGIAARAPGSMTIRWVCQARSAHPERRRDVPSPLDVTLRVVLRAHVQQDPVAVVDPRLPRRIPTGGRECAGCCGGSVGRSPCSSPSTIGGT